MEKQNNQFLFSLHHSMMLAAIPPDKGEIRMVFKAHSVPVDVRNFYSVKPKVSQNWFRFAL